MLINEHNHKYNNDTRTPDEINREIVADWQKSKNEKERADLIYIYIMVNWGFFRFRFHQYPADWLLGALYIQLTKIFPRINLDDGRASVMRYCQESLRRDLWRMWRIDNSLIAPPNQPRKEAVQEWQGVVDSVDAYDFWNDDKIIDECDDWPLYTLRV